MTDLNLFVGPPSSPGMLPAEELARELDRPARPGMFSRAGRNSRSRYRTSDHARPGSWSHWRRSSICENTASVPRHPRSWWALISPSCPRGS